MSTKPKAAFVEIVKACGMNADGSRYVGYMTRWNDPVDGQSRRGRSIWESKWSALDEADRVALEMVKVHGFMMCPVHDRTVSRAVSVEEPHAW